MIIVTNKSLYFNRYQTILKNVVILYLYYIFCVENNDYFDIDFGIKIMEPYMHALFQSYKCVK